MSRATARPDPTAVVLAFLRALARSEVDAALALVAEDIAYTNVSLPTVRGRANLARLFRPFLRPGRLGFDVCVHHVAVEDGGAVVLTDRTDELAVGRFATRFWVYGRFVVRGGRIAVWRDSFDWWNVTAGTARGLLGVLAPALNRPMPTGALSTSDATGAAAPAGSAPG